MSSAPAHAALPLAGARIALLVAPLYEDIEVHYPKLRLEEEGAEIVCVGVDESIYRGNFWSLALGARGRMIVPGFDGRVYTGVHGMPVAADIAAESLETTDFDAVVIPGGYAADHLRRSSAVLELCRQMAAAGAPVAAIDSASPRALLVTYCASSSTTRVESSRSFEVFGENHRSMERFMS